MAQTLPVIVGYGATLLATPYVVLKLGLNDFGLWSLTGAFAQYSGFLDLGIPRAVTRFTALYSTHGDDKKERAAVGSGLLILIAVGCFLVGFIWLFPRPLGLLIGSHDETLTRTLFTCSVIIFITGSVGFLFCGASVGRGRAIAPNVGLALQRVGVVVGGLATLNDPELSKFAIGSSAGGVIGLTILLGLIWLDEKRIVLGMPDRRTLAEIVPFGLKGQVGLFAELSLFQSGKILAGTLISPAAAGIIELGSRLPLGFRSLCVAAAPVITAHQTRTYATEGLDGIQRDYRNLVTRYAAATNFILFFPAAAASSLVPLWLGNSDLEVVVIVIVLSIAYAINLATIVTSCTAYAVNQVERVAIPLAIGSPIGLGATVGLAYICGLNGILAGLTLSIILVAALTVASVHRFLKIPVAAYLLALSRPLATAVVSTLSATPIGFLLQPTDRLSAVGPFLITSAIFCAVFLAAGWSMRCLPKLRI